MEVRAQPPEKRKAIERFFFDLSEEDIELAEQTALLRRHGFGRSCRWNDILRSRLVLLLSEAQSGKTFECQHRQEAMWEADQPAFYVELASVASQPWRELRSPEESERLERWRRTESEVATIFLDSVDELKLTQGRFHSALRNVANDLSGLMSRVRVVLTSRPLPVDREAFLKTFAVERAFTRPSEHEFAALALGQRTDKKEEVTPPEVRTVSLVPLSSGDVASLAEDEGISDTDRFLEGLRSASMMEFMRRPQDVIEAARAWIELGGQFGTHAEQVGFDIKARLKPNSSRADGQISDSLALDGAKRLALAVVLTQRLTIRHDVNNDRGSSSLALDPVVILPDWRDDDRKALLERALFGFASYGRVRFHNRLAFEYLAGERLSDLLDAGLSRKAVRRLLVIQTAQGLEVIRPSLQDVVAWLALRQNWVFELVRELDPAILLNLGDPGSLSSEQRQRTLSSFIDHFGAGGWRGISVPEIQIHRIAHTALGPLVRDRFDDVENIEVRQVLLELIGAAGLGDCAAIARRVVWSENTDIHERLDALDALIALDNPELAAVAAKLPERDAPWSPRFSRVAIYRLFPKWMSPFQLLAALAWLPETESTGSELSRNLPHLIADLAQHDLDELRSGLSKLVEAGLRWSENLHLVENDRGHLVHVLAATCAGLLTVRALPASAARSVALAAKLGRGMRSDDDVPTCLAKAVEVASAAVRKAIFEADVVLVRQVRPDRPALDLFRELAWRGALRFDAPDEQWVRGILPDQAAGHDLRAASLLVEMNAFARSAPDWAEYATTLTPLVADDDILAAHLAEALKPQAASREHRRWEVCHRRSEQQAARKKAKREAEWILFWRSVNADPDGAFSEERADTTAWNLWKVLGKAGARGRGTGWDRQAIEQVLGTEIAERLRAALIPVWRRETVPLESERAADDRNSFFERWRLGLAAIAAEAEDPTWLLRLSDEDAEKAIRYAPWQSSGFPAWLDAMVPTHGEVVDRLLGGEISWKLGLPSGDDGYSITLQSVRNSSPDLVQLLLPRLRTWLEATEGKPGSEDTIDGFARRLDQVIDILFAFGDDSDRKRLGEVAAAALASGVARPLTEVFLPALFEIDPTAGVLRLEAMLAEVEVGRDSAAIPWFANLFGRLHRKRGVRLNRPEMDGELLMRLLRLAYVHVRRDDDAVHEGTFSPDNRDEAESARNAILNAVIELGGDDGWQTKQQVAAEPMFSHLKDRLHALAVEKSSLEADGLAMRPDELVKFDALNEPGPRSSAEMFALLVDRLDDLRDHLLTDESPRELWAAASDERVLRRAIAGYLSANGRGAYIVAQEGVTADEKETDIRLRSSVKPIEGVIELKVGDKPYSGAALAEVARVQLVRKYLAPEGRRAGIVLITRAVRTEWVHPFTGGKLEFTGLIEMLSADARAYQAEFPEEIHIDVVGLDLQPRLPTEKLGRARGGKKPSVAEKTVNE